FNPLGSIAGVLIGSRFILSGVSVTPEQAAGMTPASLAAYRASEAAAVQLPYLVIGLGVLAWAALIRATRFPAVATEREIDQGVGALADFRALLRNRQLMLGVLAQFFYVG